MKRKIFTFLIVFVSLFSFAVGGFVLADAKADALDGLKTSREGSGLPAAGTANASGDNAKDLQGQIGVMIGYVLQFVGVIFFGLIVYGGLRWMTAAGDSAQVTEAQKIIKNAILGLVLVMSAYAITSFIGKNVAN